MENKDFPVIDRREYPPYTVVGILCAPDDRMDALVSNVKMEVSINCELAIKSCGASKPGSEYRSVRLMIKPHLTSRDLDEVFSIIRNSLEQVKDEVGLEYSWDLEEHYPNIKSNKDPRETECLMCMRTFVSNPMIASSVIIQAGEIIVPETDRFDMVMAHLDELYGDVDDWHDYFVWGRFEVD